MERPSKLLEKIAFKTKTKTEEQMLIVMIKSTHEEPLFQPLQTNCRQFERTVIFLTGYNGFFHVTSKNKNFYLTTSFSDIELGFIFKSPGVQEQECLEDGIKQFCIREGPFREDD